MRNLLIIVFLISFQFSAIKLIAQSSVPKKEISESEKSMIQEMFKQMSISDQLYRKKLSAGTLDEKILEQIDSVLNNVGMAEGLTYQKSLNLSLDETVNDSLWELQAALDFQNHLALRGLFETYGFISKEIVEEKQFVQILLLMHPPKDWDVPNYLENYSEILLKEVHSKRMPAKTYAMFVDNMKAKILREPQLYGTNQQFDPKTSTILPPIIENLNKSNKARIAIGLPILEAGEYRLVENVKGDL